MKPISALVDNRIKTVDNRIRAVSVPAWTTGEESDAVMDNRIKLAQNRGQPGKA
jgi:hypothetical protein